jgi:hypothetical protein
MTCAKYAIFHSDVLGRTAVGATEPVPSALYCYVIVTRRNEHTLNQNVLGAVWIDAVPESEKKRWTAHRSTQYPCMGVRDSRVVRRWRWRSCDANIMHMNICHPRQVNLRGMIGATNTDGMQ